MAAHNLSIRTNNALVQTFNVNDLNDLSNVTRAGTLTVAGTTTSPASSVTVNGSTANCYLDATFALGGFTATNGDNTFTAIAHDSYGRKDTNSITVNLPATNPFAYDLNGNMVTNGNEVLVWNDENQLATNYVPGSWKSVFVYDGKLRRRIERDYGWNGSAWIQTNEIHFIYDGNVIIQERDANNLPTLTLTRGNDLSGSLQGAGGIGGLLAMTQNALLLEEGSLSQATCYYHADGNGNVTMLINGSQAVVAKAEYDPFGNFISLSGSKAGVNPFWFSSKPIHRLSGKYDFLYRWYAPQLDRWPNRDPIGEREGINLFRFVLNDPEDNVDLLGLGLAPGAGYPHRSPAQKCPCHTHLVWSPGAAYDAFSATQPSGLGADLLAGSGAATWGGAKLGSEAMGTAGDALGAAGFVSVGLSASAGLGYGFECVPDYVPAQHPARSYGK